MRLAFFDFTINFGGAPQGSVYLARRLNAAHEVHVIDAYGCSEAYRLAVQQSGLAYHVLCPDAGCVYIGHASHPIRRAGRMVLQIPSFIRLRRELIKTVRRIDPDVIWVNNEKSLIFLASSRALHKYPIVVYVRGWATPDQIRPRYQRLLKRRVSAIIGHAHATIEQLKERGLPPDRLHYTPNTIPFDEICAKAQTPPAEPLPNTSKFPKLLLPAARPVREKGHLTAVNALVQLRQRGYDPVLWLPGQTATGVSNTFIEQLNELIRREHLEDNVNFLGWRQDMESLINTCDIVILPTHTEGFPRVILESMLLRKPVIATPVGGIPEAIIHEQTGLLMDIDHVDQLAAAIEQYTENHVLRETIVQRAYDYVTERYAPDINTQTVTSVFRSVLQDETP